MVTNQNLPYWALQRLAIQVHTSMARAIQPFHTTRDGDVLFAASTNEIENEKLSVADLGVVASEVAWDAVLSSVPQLDRSDGRMPLKRVRACSASPAPVSGTDFRVRNARRDRIRFLPDSLTLNPEKWPLKARRLTAS